MCVEVSEASPEYQTRLAQTYQEHFLEHKSAYDESLMDKCREQCMQLARRDVRIAMSGQSSEFTELSSIENLRKTIEQAFKDADKLAVDSMSAEDRKDEAKVTRVRAAARYNTQEKTAPLVEQFVHDTSVAPESWTAVFEYIASRMEDPDNKRKNFVQPEFEVKEFSNLSPVTLSLLHFLCLCVVAGRLFGPIPAGGGDVWRDLLCPSTVPAVLPHGAAWNGQDIHALPPAVDRTAFQ